MNNNSLTHLAISISLVLVSFIFFRGAANIANSIVVPIIFYINYAKFDLKEYLIMILAVFIFSFLFFFQQLFFIIFYAILGWVLYHIFKKEINFIVRTLIFSITFLIGFVITINITDIVIGTALRKALAAVVAGSQIGVIFLYIMTSILVAVTLNFVGYQIDRRLKENFF
ncbi:MAG: hypothetical protein ACQEQD_06165 [Bacillota bacterium]